MGGNGSRLPLGVRFWNKVKEGDGCWEWQGHRDLNGYGTIRHRPYKSSKASRVSWQIHHGEIPSGLIVCHRCDNPPCVRPSHLFLGTHKDNSMDAKAKGRLIGFPKRDACVNGHAYTPESIYTRNDGRRFCRTCDLAGQKRRYWERKAVNGNA